MKKCFGILMWNSLKLYIAFGSMAIFTMLIQPAIRFSLVLFHRPDIPISNTSEKSLHRSVLKPLRPILAARLRRRLSTDGSLGRLAEGFRMARTQGPGAFGSHLNLSSPVEIEPVRQKLLQLLRAYSPSAQIKWLLQACKLLYTALKTQAGMTPLPQPPSSPSSTLSK